MNIVQVQPKRHAAYLRAMTSMENDKARLLYASYMPENAAVPGEHGPSAQLIKLKRSQNDPFLFEVLKGKELFDAPIVHMEDLLKLNGENSPRAVFHVTLGCGSEMRKMQSAIAENPGKSVERVYESLLEAEAPQIDAPEEAVAPPLDDKPQQLQSPSLRR